MWFVPFERTTWEKSANMLDEGKQFKQVVCSLCCWRPHQRATLKWQAASDRAAGQPGRSAPTIRPPMPQLSPLMTIHSVTSVLTATECTHQPSVYLHLTLEHIILFRLTVKSVMLSTIGGAWRGAVSPVISGRNGADGVDADGPRLRLASHVRSSALLSLSRAGHLSRAAAAGHLPPLEGLLG